MTGFDDRMAELRTRFVERAKEDRAALTAALVEGDHAAVRRIAHSLAGNAGIFGFPGITDAARAIEDALDARVRGDMLQRLCRNLDKSLATLP